MNFTYCLYILTFLIFPTLGLLVSKKPIFTDAIKYNKILAVFFIVHNIAFFCGFSVKGDYLDYILFSIEYFYLTLIVLWLYKKTDIFSKIIRGLGITLLIIGFIQGLIGTIMFLVISQDFETDKIYRFQNIDKSYETRRYSFGFATQIDIRYTFVTYKNINFMPFEQKIDNTDFFGMKSNLDFGDEKFRVNIVDSLNTQQIVFCSSECYTKKID
jgi:hypothetical protein